MEYLTEALKMLKLNYWERSAEFCNLQYNPMQQFIQGDLNI